MDLPLAALGGPLPDGNVQTQDVAAPDPFDFGQANGFYIPWDEREASPRRGFLRGYGIQGGIGRKAPAWYLLAQGEMLPKFDNQVTLDPHRTDAWGIPAARIDCSFGSNEKTMIAQQVAMLERMGAAAGFTVRMPPSGKPLERAAFRLWRKRLMSSEGAFLRSSRTRVSPRQRPVQTECPFSIFMRRTGCPFDVQRRVSFEARREFSF